MVYVEAFASCSLPLKNCSHRAQTTFFTIFLRTTAE